MRKKLRRKLKKSFVGLRKKIRYNSKSVVVHGNRIQKLKLPKYTPLTYTNTPAVKSTPINPKHKAKLYNSLYSKPKKCRVTLADAARRNAFFKAKTKGGSARPEHNRKHKRTC